MHFANVIGCTGRVHAECEFCGSHDPMSDPKPLQSAFESFVQTNKKEPRQTFLTWNRTTHLDHLSQNSMLWHRWKPISEEGNSHDRCKKFHSCQKCKIEMFLKLLMGVQNFTPVSEIPDRCAKFHTCQWMFHNTLTNSPHCLVLLLKDKVQTAEILPPLPPESRSREGETTILL